ncbi:NAD(P)-dependent oxidoreductase [Pseudomonadales bacterium]|nr:NAD(P)-dependent oxidoreductase [Pseudomonadales bacterium]
MIFGGTGFIGICFARYLVDKKQVQKVYLYDHEALSTKASFDRQKMLASYSCINEIHGDVRQPIDWIPPETITLIANFAAVHREPGHVAGEYFETNLLGADNVCNWAEKVNCKKIIFSSSIAPYGPSEHEKDESFLPVPPTPYGGSKLVAEKIHQTWQAKESENRQLVIVRPGVVFGPGEGGNVSRLIKAVRNRYFFYTGNQKTRKAGVYVKELCNAMCWVLNSEKAKADKVTLFNMTMNPGPSIEEYVDTIAKVMGIKIWIPSIPIKLLLVASYFIDLFARPLGIEHPFSPVRIKKLTRSNNIIPMYLATNEYKYKYTLEEALIDWKKECPEEWS